jgi:hypothetical protein
MRLINNLVKIDQSIGLAKEEPCATKTPSHQENQKEEEFMHSLVPWCLSGLVIKNRSLRPVGAAVTDTTGGKVSQNPVDK